VKCYTYMDGPLGRILLVSEHGALIGLYFVGQKYEVVPNSDWSEERDSPLVAQAKTELAEYFAGKRTAFNLPLRPRGTPFQLHVWQNLVTIPCGTTVTYGAIAESLGAPRSVRAAASAIGRNPISIVIPCHRVIGSNGSLTGYAGGLARKRALLALEAAALPLLQHPTRSQEEFDEATRRSNHEGTRPGF
jgi:methylated-DNA-[protein]-cysteine S-methyltransferase